MILYISALCDFKHVVKLTAHENVYFYITVKLPEDIRESTTMITGIDEHIDAEDDDEAEDYIIITIVLITTTVVAAVLLIVVILTKQKCRDFS